MKLWIDDLREPPEGWTWAKNSIDAIRYLDTHEVEEVSFDHDLGGDDTTRPVVIILATFNWWPEICRVHTANPVGREYLEGMINRYGPGVTA